MKKILTIALCLVFFLAGCNIRSRMPEETVPLPEKTAEEAGESPETEEGAEEADISAEPDVDPEGDRRVYASDASAELSPDAENPLTVPETEADAPAPIPADDAASGAEASGEEENLVATRTLAAEEADALSASSDGAAAETVLLYYQTLLDDRLGPLFECKRLYVYWETAEDYHTVHKTSPEHEIILLSGSYDCSAKLLEDALTVNEGWIERKNPGAVVKCVDASILGRGVLSSSAAEAAYDALLARPEWRTSDAGKTDTAILLSEDLLRSPAGQTAAALFVAKELYPTAFEDLDPAEALAELMEESAGTPLSGIYAYFR